MKAVVLIETGFESLQQGINTWMDKESEYWCNPREVILDAQGIDEVHILMEEVSKTILPGKGTVMVGFLAPNNEDEFGYYGIIEFNEDGGINEIQYPINARFY